VLTSILSAGIGFSLWSYDRRFLGMSPLEVGLPGLNQRMACQFFSLSASSARMTNSSADIFFL
jgi:hypothetical protein